MSSISKKGHEEAGRDMINQPSGGQRHCEQHAYMYNHYAHRPCRKSSTVDDNGNPSQLHEETLTLLSMTSHVYSPASLYERCWTTRRKESPVSAPPIAILNRSLEFCSIRPSGRIHRVLTDALAGWMLQSRMANGFIGSPSYAGWIWTSFSACTESSAVKCMYIIFKGKCIELLFNTVEPMKENTPNKRQKLNPLKGPFSRR